MGKKQKNSKKKSTNRKIQKKAHNSAETIAQLGMFIAVAMVFSYIESFIRIDIAVPGIKLGLANIVTIVVLCKLGLADAVLVSVLRIFLSSLLFGNFTVMIYSLAGAAVSMLFMWISVKIGFFSTTGTSILGGVGHNVGQLIVAYLVIKNQNILIYAPVLLVSGTITGVLIGLAAVFVMRAVGGQIGKF
jgi:heptaprenyl diphosphate synthase